MALVVGVVLLAIIGRRSRDLTTAILSLMAVAIAINIAVGSIVYALRLPIYLDSIGTVLVGALAGPWAGALTGILSNLIWSILPIPGGASPTAAFFAPVAGVIGLMAGFWASRGVFQFRSDDARVGGFLSLAAGFVGRGDRAAGRPGHDRPHARLRRPGFAEPVRRHRPRHRRDRRRWSPGSPGGPCSTLRPSDPRIRTYLIGATAVAAFVLVVALFRLLFGPTGYFSAVNGKDPDGDGPLGPLFGGADLSFLALPDPQGPHRGASSSALIVGVLAYRWARSGEHARLFPVWIGGADDRPGRGDDVGADRGRRVRRRHRRRAPTLLVALFRTLGLSVLQSAFAQGLTSDPLDKTISFTVVFLILGALPVTVRTMYSRGETTVVE